MSKEKLEKSFEQPAWLPPDENATKHHHAMKATTREVWLKNEFSIAGSASPDGS
jgi:hypothetical protein